MTRHQSTVRLVLYVAAAVLASASAGLPVVDFADPKAITGYILSILATGVITARSYIDESPSQVPTRTPDDEEAYHEP